ncbi:metacaspase-4-like [Lolium rigidum]|uniref:metacaspase-4-like n=1 Tax=Lolium rigidum TaxID=89674 RepID=UPI001F5C9FFB|nr:metacaspase-4-like [Lolium rigidum]XP_047095006.1 metacaspase-4-like [Lolium rigidum]
MGRKRAVLVGINYPGTEGELKGCLNDVARMRRCLVDRFGFDDADIRVLADADQSTPPPTGANIRLELERLVGDAQPGDTLFFHYSGHGLQLPPETGQEDDTGYDECIVPCDTNLIKDQDFTELVRKVPDGCLFTMVSDSCHSGGLIDKTKEQIGNSTKQGKVRQRQREMRPPSSGANMCASLIGAVRGALEYIGIRLPRRGNQKQSADEAKAQAATVASRSLPLSTYIRMLKQQTGKEDVGVGSIRATLFHHFGEDATPKIKKFVKAMLTRNAKPDGDEGGDQADALGLGPAMQEEVRGVEEVYAGAAARVPPRNGVLISGCQTDENSSDLTMADGASYGALSNAIQAVLAEEKRGKVVTNRELVLRARGLLSKQGYVQKPGLYCSDEHADAAFIC